ncbi:MAG: TraB/GumN family protein [Pseudomonadota bacterium]
MIRKSIARAFAAALILAPAAVFAQTCGGEDRLAAWRAEDPDGIAAAEARAAAHANAEGVFWRVEKAGLPTSWLLGTHHFADADPDAPYAEALGDARVLFVEITETEEAAMAAAMASDPTLIANAEPRPLETLIDPDLAARAKERLAAFGIPAEATAMLKPWFVNLLLAVPPCVAAMQQAGETGMDKDLQRLAAERGIEARGLETWREQIEAFKAFLGPDPAEALSMTLADPEDPESVLRTGEALYEQERVMMIWEVTIERARPRVPNIDEFVPAAWDAIAAKRNRNMADRAAEELAKGGVFIAVGALHLPTEDGLVELLRADGYEVTRVE